MAALSSIIRLSPVIHLRVAVAYYERSLFSLKTLSVRLGFFMFD